MKEKNAFRNRELCHARVDIRFLLAMRNTKLIIPNEFTFDYLFLKLIVCCCKTSSNHPNRKVLNRILHYLFYLINFHNRNSYFEY